MVIQPKRTKFRKDQRGRVRGRASAGATVAFGEYGLQVTACGWLKVPQIESARKALTHYLKRGGKVWVRVLADKSYTARPAETRMGSGKGAPVGYVAAVRAGHILFELAGVTAEEAKEAFRLASHKLPLPTRLVQKG